MATRAQLVRRIAALGCTLDEMRSGGGFNIDPPRGKVFEANMGHTLAYYFKGWRRGELYADVLEDLAAGLAECGETECDTCHPEVTA